MTAAGIAFIAGGLATLISLRSVLFGGGKARRAAERAEADRKPEAAAVRMLAAPPVEEPVAMVGEPPAMVEDPPVLVEEPLMLVEEPAGDPASDLGGLASIGLVGEDDFELAEAAADDEAQFEGPEVDEPREPDPEPVTLGDEEARSISVRRVDRSDRRYGDRVDGWVRPEYHDDPAEPSSGEYWTPVPMDARGFDLADDDPEPSAKGYGWPIRIERLPAVPDYEPATGFDMVPVPAEPAEPVPVWPPEDRPVRRPRSWSNRNEKPAENRFLENESAPRRRTGRDDRDQRFRAPNSEPDVWPPPKKSPAPPSERRRPRPRPRPGPDPDNAYVSRHAAEPPR
jgi:hypothetical protein